MKEQIEKLFTEAVYEDIAPNVFAEDMMSLLKSLAVKDEEITRRAYETYPDIKSKSISESAKRDLRNTRNGYIVGAKRMRDAYVEFLKL